MICADFLAGVNLDKGDPETLLFSMKRFFKFLPEEQRKAFLGGSVHDSEANVFMLCRTRQALQSRTTPRQLRRLVSHALQDVGNAIAGTSVPQGRNSPFLVSSFQNLCQFSS